MGRSAHMCRRAPLLRSESADESLRCSHVRHRPSADPRQLRRRRTAGAPSILFVDPVAGTEQDWDARVAITNSETNMTATVAVPESRRRADGELVSDTV